MTWHLRFDDGHTGLPEIKVENAGGGPVCTIYHTDDEDLANASLILAAPAMLEACQAALKAICAGRDLRDSVEQLRAAIAMATPNLSLARSAPLPIICEGTPRLPGDDVQSQWRGQETIG
jgi:hypothetical protein